MEDVVETPEKVIIPETKWANEEIEYSGVKVSVYPYISVENESNLILQYVAQYFAPTVDESKPKWNDVITSLVGRNIWYANYSLCQGILSSLTNVDVDKLSPEQTIDLANVVAGIVINFHDFRSRLDDVVWDVKNVLEQQKSIGSVIDNLSNKILEVLESLKSIDVEGLSKVGKDLLTQVEQSPVASIFQEAQKDKQIKTKKKKE